MARPAHFTALSDLPPDEAARLQALHERMILDSGVEPEFDLLTRVAAELCDAPYAFVTLVDADRTWIKSAHGASITELPRSHSYCPLALLEREPLLQIGDVSADPRTAHVRAAGLPGKGLYAGAVLQTDAGHRLGTLCVVDGRCRELDGERQALLQGLARQAMQLIELRALRHELERAASSDPLTALGNRRALMQRLRDEAGRCSRYGAGFSVVLLDLDHFKAVNDANGHDAGDTVLANTADLLRAMLRSADFAARYGGEEFCVLLPHTDLRGALTWAEHFRLRLAEFEHRHEQASIRLTASIGIAHAAPHCEVAIRTLLQAADAALYRAKQRGRNRTELAE